LGLQEILQVKPQNVAILILMYLVNKRSCC